MTEADLAAFEQELTDGEPLVSESERGYIAECRRLLAEVRRLQAGLADWRLEHPDSCSIWYSSRCSCGADEHNDRIDALLGEAA